MTPRLFMAAAMIPAICVPWPLLSVYAPSPSSAL
jgi:hypothetical protein